MFALTFLICVAVSGGDGCYAIVQPVFYNTERACQAEQAKRRVALVATILLEGGEPFYLASSCVRVRELPV